MTGYIEEKPATEASKSLREEVAYILSYWHVPPYQEKPSGVMNECSFSYQPLIWHYGLTLRGNGITLGLQTFTRKPNPELQYKREDKRGQRQVICSKAHYLMSTRKRKRLK